MNPLVAIDARMIEHSGIGTYLKNLLENYATLENHYLFRVICPSEKTPRGLPADRFQFLPAKTHIYTLNEQWEVAGLARRSQMLHCPHYNAALLYRGKLVVTIHDLIHLTEPTFKRLPEAWIYARPMFALVARRADYFIADSEFTKRQIVEHLRASPSKVSVVYLGVKDHFHPRDRALALERAFSLLRLDRPYILFVGNLKPNKNLETLLHAFAQLCASRDFDHQLVILGDDRRWKAGLVSESQNLKISSRVLFVSRLPYEELPWVYGAADLLVMPSTIEGFGLPVLEAMACRTPVVCSRASSLPEVAGDAAQYFETMSADDLAAAIRKVLGSSELQETLRCKGLQQVKRFSWRECARQTLEVYRKVLEA